MIQEIQTYEDGIVVWPSKFQRADLRRIVEISESLKPLRFSKPSAKTLERLPGGFSGLFKIANIAY